MIWNPANYAQEIVSDITLQHDDVALFSREVLQRAQDYGSTLNVSTEHVVTSVEEETRGEIRTIEMTITYDADDGIRVVNTVETSRRRRTPDYQYYAPVHRDWVTTDGTIGIRRTNRPSGVKTEKVDWKKEGF